MQAPPPPAPAVFPPKPRYLLLPVQVPQAPIVRMDELNEQPAKRASDVYPTTMSTSLRSENERRNFVKLVQARFSQITWEDHDMIAGQGTAAAQDACVKQQKKWAENFQGQWIGAGSWIQKFIAGAIFWRDYQVLLNNMHRHVKLLSIAVDGEPGPIRAARRQRGREYKKALQAHENHIRRSVAYMIENVEEKINTAGRNRNAGAGEAQMRDLERELDNLRIYEDGLRPQNTVVVFHPTDIEPEEEFFGEMDINFRIAWLRGLWSKDVFVSWMWEFQGVLHFRRNWDNPVIRNLYEDKFVILADNVNKFIISRRNIKASCRMSTSSLVRTSIVYEPDPNLAYSEFKEVDKKLETTAPGGVGGYGRLFVAGDPHLAARTSKRQA